MVEAHGLVKRFGDFVAVDGVDFTIAKGESFGFLGPNGAGKTSTMRMISCISPLSGGTLRVLGHGPGHGRRRASGPAWAWCPRRTRSTSSSRCSTTS